MDNDIITDKIILQNNIKINEIKYISLIIKNVLNGNNYKNNDKKLYQIVYRNINEKNK